MLQEWATEASPARSAAARGLHGCRTRQGGYVVDLDKDRLQGAPSYSSREAPDWGDPGYGRRIDDYHGPSPGS
jgi:hypothetical protein